MIRLLVSIFVVFSIIFMFSCSSSDDEEDANSGTPIILGGQKLLTDRCSACHSLDRVYQKKTDRSGWEKIVDNMIQNGAKLNADERKALIDYILTL